MKPTPIKKEIVDTLIESLGIKDFAKATIREVKQVAAKAEKESGVEYIKMEMGIPGLPAAQVGVDAQIKALQDGIAHSYPDIQGYPELKKQASRFVKAFINVDIAPEGCVPVCGSMQGTFASFLTCSQATKGKDTVPSTCTTSVATSWAPNWSPTSLRARSALSSIATPTTPPGSV